MKDVFHAIHSCWLDGGPLLLPIALVAFAIWAYLGKLRTWLKLTLSDSIAAGQSLDAWISGQITQETMWNETQQSGTALAGWLGQWPKRDGARQQFEEITEKQWSAVQRDRFLLKALTAAAPLLGLLGTVTGMMGTFTAVAYHGAESAAPVARGISSALITTQFGLIAALPGVFGLLHIDRLCSRLRSAQNAIGMSLRMAQAHSLCQPTEPGRYV